MRRPSLGRILSFAIFGGGVGVAVAWSSGFWSAIVWGVIGAVLGASAAHW